jgi:hypothetical protein
MCANYNSDITLGGVTIYATQITPIKRPKTIKQKIGTDVIEIKILGASTSEYVLDITGVLYANTFTLMGTARAALEALDDGEPHALVDGIHDGNYIVATESLKFEDSGEDAGSLMRFTMKLIQQ